MVYFCLRHYQEAKQAPCQAFSSPILNFRSEATFAFSIGAPFRHSTQGW